MKCLFQLMIASKFEKELKNKEQNDLTAKLWLQYFHMVTSMKNVIEAKEVVTGKCTCILLNQ